MASPGNANQPGGGSFDMHKFFKPSTTPPPSTSPNPNSQNTSSSSSSSNNNPHLISSLFPTPLASYPPSISGPYYPQFNHHIPQYNNPPQQLQDNHFGNLHPNHGARLMALLSVPQSTMPMPPIQPTNSGSELSGFSGSPNVGIAHSGSGPIWMPSSKLPKGRHLNGDHVVYDIDVRLPGEVQPELEVTPITKYGSDPGLVLGRQIAVNKTYICYGLKLGAIRVLNMNAALRSLLKGLSQRVTDMAFFAEDVHLLASASVDGHVYIWKITEGPDEEDNPQITGRIVLAVQVVDEGGSVHPRVCWHCHKQEILVVGIGRRILKIDTTKVGKGEVFSADEPLRCPVDRLVDGVQIVGTHDGEVTDLSMCQWMTTRLVSASTDGTIKIWEDRKPLPIAVLRPHDGQPVNSVTFLVAPHRPDHIILITGGPLNREVKIWSSASEEGWLLPSDAESWHCMQTLELKSSAEARVEDAFFNQAVALSQAGLLLLANAKKNAIYAVHLEYGPNPAATRMDYMSEFTVTMPILSFTGTSDLLPHGELIVQVYCVQTQAIQQYALDLSQCLPPPMENLGFERTGSSVSREAASIEGFAPVDPPLSKQMELPLSSSAPKSSVHESSSEIADTNRLATAAPTDLASSQVASSIVESELSRLPTVTSDTFISPIKSPPLSMSPKLSRKLSGFRSPLHNIEPVPPISDRVGDPNVVEYSVDRQIDAIHPNLSDVTSLDDEPRNDETKVSHDDGSSGINHPIKFKHPTHLVTPSEILMANSSSEVNQVHEQKGEGELNIQDVVMNSEARKVEVEVKVVGETRFSQKTDIDSQELNTFVSEKKEKAFCSQVSDLGIEMARESHALSPEIYTIEDSRQFHGASGSEGLAETTITAEGNRDSAKETSEQDLDSAITVPAHQPPAPSGKGKKQKGRKSQGSGSSSPSHNAFNSSDSYNEAGMSSSVPSMEAAFSQLLSMREMINQLLTMQKETQKQMEMTIAAPVTKEGRRLEVALGRRMEKTVKANSEALWARFQEESAKQEKSFRDHTQQMTSLISNCLNKDMPGLTEKILKKELGAVGQAVARNIAPTIEKTVSAAISDAFQKGVGDKAVNQLEKSVYAKLEATVARQIQAQFQASGKLALQETLKSTLEASVIPAFEISCKAMFEQVDLAFQKGLAEHIAAAQQQFESMHLPLSFALRDAINSASSMTRTLSGELADGQRKLVPLAVSGSNSKTANSLVSHVSNGPLPHEKLDLPLDPTKELSRLLVECKYEDAFTAALQRSDLSIVSWLCSQVDLPGILSMNPLPLSQGVLFSLLQQLAFDISNETARKLSWIGEVLSAMNTTDPMIAGHVRPIFDQVYQILMHHRNLPTTTAAELSSIRLLMHVINSMLMTSK